MIVQGENLYQIGSALAQALWSGLWIGLLVAAIVFAYVRLNRGLNAASRHVAWYAALVIIAALPAVSFVSSLARIHIDPTPAPIFFSYVVPEAPADAVLSGGTNAAGATTATPALVRLPSLSPVALERIAIAVAAVLASIALARIVVLFVGLVGLWKVKRASRRIDPALSPTLVRTMARDRDARAVSLRLSDTLEAPAAAGFRSPAILLPADLIDSLDRDSLDQIAMHEYAHLRRYDDWTNLFQRFVERIFWFNPAIWFVGKRIDLEREIACDDWAVAGADGVSGYADCLWQLARQGRVPSFAATAPGAFVAKSQIAARIEHLLERRRDGAPTLRTSRLLAIAPVLAGALVLVAGRAPSIALHAQAPAPTAAQLEQIHIVQLALVQATALGVAPAQANVDVEKVHLEAPIAPGLLAAGGTSHHDATGKSGAPAGGDCPSRKHPKTRGTTSTGTTTLASATTAAAAHTAHATAAHTARALTVKTETAWVIVPARATQAETASAAASANAGDGLATVHPVRSLDRTATLHPMRVRTASPKHFTFVEAAADETDNLSFGPNDRDLIAHCSGCDLSNKDLHGADLHGLTLTGDDLSGADLRGANLRQTVLTGVDLTNARLDNADLRGAVLTGTDISGATFAGAKTDGIRLVGMQLTSAILQASSVRSIIDACAGCDLSNLDLRGRDLHGITLDGADLHGADLSGANLRDARFNGVDLSGVKFHGTDLRGAEFNGCDLSGVDLSQARTDGIEIRGSSLEDTTTDASDSNP